MNSDPLVIDVFTAGDASYVRVDVVGVQGVSRDPTVLDARASDVPYADLKIRPLQRLGIVRECGEKLCTSLISNPGVLATLDRFQTPAANTRHPIYVSVGQPEHENLPWEAIWRKTVEFFALGEHWPIARLASAANDTEEVERVIDDVPRIMAVIAAEGADVVGEWGGFEALLQDFDGDFDMHVMLASDALKAHIEGLGHARVKCSYVGETAAEVAQKIRTYAPNVIHFFSHGTSHGGGSLALINRLFETVQLRSDDLLPLSQSENLCLVVLNCCLAGNADPNDHAGSIARELVKAGLPAAVAMREIITDKAASVFTKAFYAELLTQFRNCLKGHAAGDSINVPDDTWLDALSHARRALKPEQPADALEWTLPLIYVRRGELRFRKRTHGDAKKAAKDDILRSFHETLRNHAGAEDFLQLLRERLKE